MVFLIHIKRIFWLQFQHICRINQWRSQGGDGYFKILPSPPLRNPSYLRHWNKCSKSGVVFTSLKAVNELCKRYDSSGILFELQINALPAQVQDNLTVYFNRCFTHVLRQATKQFKCPSPWKGKIFPLLVLAMKIE